MNTDRNDYFDFIEDENPIQIRQLLSKYLRYWPYFLLAVFLTSFSAYAYLRYADVIYTTKADVKIIDDKKNSNFTLDMSKMFGKSAVNLENEVALLKSVRLSEQVVKKLNLNVIYKIDGAVMSRKVSKIPFVVSYALPEDSLKTNYNFAITITKSGYTITDENSGKFIKTAGYWMNDPLAQFPITIRPSSNKDMTSVLDESYMVSINTVGATALALSKSIGVESVGEESDIISLTLNGTDGKRSEQILNTLIQVFGEDGVVDNQQVSRRTIDFVNDRFVYLRKELDSIEISKKDYKKNNNLSFIQADAGASILDKNAKEQALFDVNGQLILAQLLKENIESQKVFDLLPANIGIQNAIINQLVEGYNRIVLDYQKLSSSAGVSNPALQVLSNALLNQKKNIVSSINGYKKQLQITRAQGEVARSTAEGNFSSLPENEKVLRSIERQQDLKESLYLLLLQKKEEASINLAVTVPNTKIIDYAITNSSPISPKKNVIYLAALLLGLGIPFSILFLIFKLDDKIHNAADVESKTSSIPILAELPLMLDTADSKIQSLESFRTLVNNTNFITPVSNKTGRVIFATSSIKGEGKTFVSFNLAKAYAQLDKKVILIGVDFRNPQLHLYIDQTRKSNQGLSNYLHDPTKQWRDFLCPTDTEGYSFDVLLSGDIPPNPTLLLSSQRFASLIDELKKVYDLILFDTPPTLLVTDTLIISKYADTTLYVVRSGITEKKLIKYSNKLNEDKKISNMGYVINAIDFSGSYGSGYGYNYNYGYGYGYNADHETKPWYKRLFTKKTDLIS